MRMEQAMDGTAATFSFFSQQNLLQNLKIPKMVDYEYVALEFTQYCLKPSVVVLSANVLSMPISGVWFL